MVGGCILFIKAVPKDRVRGGELSVDFGDLVMHRTGLEVATRYLLPTATREEPSCTCVSSTRKGLLGVFHANEEMWEKRSLGALQPIPPRHGRAARQGLTGVPLEQGLVPSLWEMKREASYDCRAVKGGILFSC